MYRYLLFIALILFCCLGVSAQTIDTVSHPNKKDSLNRKPPILKPFAPIPKAEKVFHPDSTHSPHKAIMKSLIFPGLGQIYNKHGLWWRLPAIYGGIGLLLDAVIFNAKSYSIFLKESEWRVHGRVGDEPLPQYVNIDDQTIYSFKDNQRRNRDLSIFGLVGAWGLNMIDAYVEAKFIHSYTMDSNFSFKVTPTITPAPVYASNFNPTFTPALKITFTF